MGSIDARADYDWSWSRTPPALAGRRVLVVGRAAAAAGFVGLLRRLGAHVVTCDGLERALVLLQRFVMDIVIADPELRDVDGEPISRVLRGDLGASTGVRLVAPPPRIGLAEPAAWRVAAALSR
jgi:hypothetical protein